MILKQENKVWKFGIEHEIPLIKDKFLDYRNIKPEILNKVVQKFPIYQNDYPYLRIGDLGLKIKRLYIEGLEIFDRFGYLVKQYPKGFELRTPLAYSIEEAIQHLYNDFQIVKKELLKFKIFPTFISFNPYLEKVNIKIKIHSYEKKLRKDDPGRKTAPFTLLTFGPDLNISFSELNDNDILDIVQKLNYYTPFIIPFSFSSPFYKGKLWVGQSIRCFLRLQKRTAVCGFIKDESLIKKFKKNWLLSENRIEHEKGRIEYKALDTIQDLKVYKGLFALFKGLILDKKLKEKTIFLDKNLINESVIYGFDNKTIYEGANEILHRAKEALKKDKDSFYLNILFDYLKRKTNLSKIMINEFKKYNSIERVLLKHTNFIK